MWNLKHHTCPIHETETDAKTQRTHTRLPRGSGWRELDRGGAGNDPCTQWANKVPLELGAVIQHPGTSHDGKEEERNRVCVCVHIYIYKINHCAAEINTL